MKKIFTLVLLFCSLLSFSQSMKNTPPKRCSTTDKWLEMVAKDPSLIQKKEEEEKKIQKWIAENANSKAPLFVTIPVVVQIFGSTPNTVVTDTKVNQQIARLNADFRRTNTDASNTPSTFSSVVADCEIEFCLATLDPNGDPTTGIVRYTGVSSPTNSYLWDAGSYLNLFVYDVGGPLGYTYVPSTSVNEAVHIGYSYFGNTSDASYNLGRTATHEVGHWLNLEHIWADATCGNDFVSDTPPQEAANYGCKTHPFNVGGCTGNTTGEMFMNYMDYTDDDCMNSFTIKQKERMHAAINTYRSGLLTSNGCSGSGTVSANFTGTPTTVQVTNSVAFTDQSFGGPTSWSWAFEGGTPSTSTAQNPSITYNTVGTYNVTLTVSDGTTSDTEIKTDYITVQTGPAYCTASTTNGTAEGDFINTVSLGTINNANTGGTTGADYYDYTSMSTDLNVSTAYVLSIKGGSYQPDRYAAWIDYNQDGDFADTNEKLGEFSTTATNQTKTINFTVPAAPSTGTTRMRVRCLYNNGANGLDPCATGDYGETEDYSVNILSSSCGGFSVATTGSGLTCLNNNGTISSSITGGTSAFSYSWSNSKTTSTITGLSSGTYTLTVTDANSCTATSITTLTLPSSPTAAITATGSTCGNSNGSSTVTPSGGSTPYSYLWSNSKTTSANTGIASGTYSVTVTDNKSCTVVKVVTVTGTTSPTASVTSTASSCTSATGTATVTAASGTTPYTYLWSNSKTTANITTLNAGTYTVTVSDNNSCTTSTSVTVGQSSAPSVSLSSSNSTCGNSNGSATATASGGTTPYTYLWSNAKTTASITAIASGTYTVTVTAANSCTTSASVAVNNTSGPSVSISTEDEICGAADGTATASLTGGTSPFSYLWSSGSTSTSLSSLAAGTYSLTVTDNNSCTATSSVSVSNLSPSLSVSATNSTCGSANGAASVSVSNGATPYSYEWSNGGTASSISSVSSGTYSVTVTDNNSCSATETVTLNNTSLLSVFVTTSSSSCGLSDGSATAFAGSGTVPYVYSWSNGGTTTSISNVSAGLYSLTVTDNSSCVVVKSVTVSNNSTFSASATSSDESCGQSNGSAEVTASGGDTPYSYNWSNGSTVAAISSLSQGDFTVTVTDNSSCSEVLNIAIAEIAGPSLSLTSSDEGCDQSNGSISSSVTSGTSPYTYLWSDNSTTSSLIALSAGNYSLTITDANGCVATETTGISNVAGPTLQLTSSDETCTNSNGSVSSLVSGGTSPFDFSWSNGETTDNLTNVAAGSYFLTVTDNNGCTASSSADVFNFAAPSVSISTSTATCGMSTGSASADVSGGSSPFSYLWSNGSTTSTLSNVASGQYFVSVTDANACLVETSGIVNEINDLTYTTSVTGDVTCFGGADGSASITVSGGSTPYSYLWDDGQTADAASNLDGGEHQINVSDALGCSLITFVTVGEASEILVSTATTSTNSLCQGTATASVTNGVSPFTYSWSNGATAASLSGLCVGQFDVTVTDSNGCQQTATADVLDNGISSVYESWENAMKIYPNPVKDNLTIALNNSVSMEHFEVKIYSYTGQLVYRFNEKQISPEFSLDVNTEHFSSGIYMIQLLSDKNEVSTHRVIKN